MTAAPGPAMDLPASFHYTHPRLVEFADTDVAGIAHFANFFRYVEAAEHAFFRSLGHPPHTVSGTTQVGWPRLETSCRFHRPARFGDELAVNLRLHEVRTTSLSYRFWITRPVDATLLADGLFSIVHVTIDTASHSLQNTPFPPTLREKLAVLLAS